MSQLSQVIVVGLVTAILGALLAWLFLRSKPAELKIRLEERDREVTALRGELTAVREKFRVASNEAERLSGTLDAERASSTEKLALLDGAKAQLKEAFAAVSQQALLQNNQSFLDLAQTKLADFQRTASTDLDARQQAIDLLVKPVHEGLQLVGDRLLAFDRERATSHATIQENLRQVALTHGQLASETQALVNALRAPQVRGQWGELQLRRVVELAGMQAHCDFTEQQSVESDDGRLRPDMLVNLPGRKLVVVDSKAPMAAYLEALEATDDAARGLLLDRHAKQVRDHVVGLSSKDYASQFPEAPDFVVMFLPGEAFFSAACQRDASLIDFAISRGVIPASPTTLITVLKAVSYGWQQERIAENAEEIRALGQQLYERMRNVADSLIKVRKGLESAVNGYNAAVGTMEARVLPSARKFRDLGSGSGDEIDLLEPVNLTARVATATELGEPAQLTAGNANED